MQPIEGMTTADLTAENKALLKKKAEIAERQALISTEVAKRSIAAKAKGLLAGMSEDEIDSLESAVKRAKARRKQAHAEHHQGSTGGSAK
jgi:hypothetical protein